MTCLSIWISVGITFVGTASVGMKSPSRLWVFCIEHQCNPPTEVKPGFLVYSPVIATLQNSTYATVSWYNSIHMIWYRICTCKLTGELSHCVYIARCRSAILYNYFFSINGKQAVSCLSGWIALLCIGSRRVFGTVVEKSCVFLIDMSGSMDPHMDELRKELVHLVWEQLHKYSIRLASSVHLSTFKCSL